MPNVATVQAVSNVTRATRALDETSPKHAIEGLLRRRVEACSEYYGAVIPARYHPFVAAVNAAFCDHRPLVLSPDMFWLLIAQGFARYVNAHSETLRRRFVPHEGKETLVVRRDDFVKGSPENPWGEVFSQFSDQIKQHIGEENHSNIVASFSTTSAIERAANEIVLMNSMKSYFEYRCDTRCGIPEVTLEGTAEDWNELRRRTEVLGDAYELTWWTSRIVPTLERIAQNAAGADDPALWNNIYKIRNLSGGTHINGWITDFFPYLQTIGFVHNETNELVDDWKLIANNRKRFREQKIDVPNWLFSAEPVRGITHDSLPGSLCSAPFTWHYHEMQFEMEFIAGFMGFTQDAKTLAVRPKIGWAVRQV